MLLTSTGVISRSQHQEEPALLLGTDPGNASLLSRARTCLGAAHGTELRAVNRHPLALHQPCLPRHPHQLRPGRSHRIAVHATELGDGLVIRRLPKSIGNLRL
jgi:hypothetical protein